MPYTIIISGRQSMSSSGETIRNYFRHDTSEMLVRHSRMHVKKAAIEMNLESHERFELKIRK